MLRKASEAVPDGNGPVPQKEELGSGQPTMEDVYRMMKEAFDRWDKKMDEISDKMEKYIEERGSIDQRLTRLEHGARQPRVAMEADGQANTKTRKRTEGAGAAVQTMRGGGFPVRRVNPGPNTNSTSFSVKAEPPAFPCRDDVVVEGGDIRDVSPILGDVVINSRWWLSSHRRSFLSQGDQFQPATSSVLLDRGDG